MTTDKTYSSRGRFWTENYRNQWVTTKKELMQILPFRKSHIDSIVELNREFDKYLGGLSSFPRDTFDPIANKQKLMRYWVGKEKSFSGYIAKIDDDIVGYAFYHYGFDPDEMQGKIIHLIDFFVSEKVRRKWVGRALIEKLQSHEDSLWLYFWVWKKNLPAIEFYKKMGADWVEDVPFMKLIK